MFPTLQANPNNGDGDGMTALLFAASRGAADCVTQLLAARADVAAKASADEFAGQDALRIACNRSTAVATSLLEAKATAFEGFSSAGFDCRGLDKDQCDTAGFHALHVASKNGDITALRMLLKQKPALDVVKKSTPTNAHHKGWTALHFASKHGKTGIVKELLAAGMLNELCLFEPFIVRGFVGATVNKRAPDGVSPLMLAANSVASVELTRRLLEAKADPAGALETASNDIECVQLLLDAKAQPRSADSANTIFKRLLGSKSGEARKEAVTQLQVLAHRNDADALTHLAAIWHWGFNAVTNTDIDKVRFLPRLLVC